MRTNKSQRAKAESPKVLPDPATGYPRIEGRYVVDLDPNGNEVRRFSPEAIKAAKPITSLAEFQEQCQKSFTIYFEFDNDLRSIEGRRTTPAEDAALDAIEHQTCIPPIVRGKTMDDDRPDFNNVDYIKNKAAAQIEARALGLYWCAPVFRAEKPGLNSNKEIVEFIQSKFTTDVLQTIWGAIRNGGVGLAELVNFT